MTPRARVLLFCWLLLLPLAGWAQWAYKRVPDEMRNTVSVRAQLASNNTHQLAFPYHGGSSLIIIAWDEPGTEAGQRNRYVGLALHRGQFSCYPNETCFVQVKPGNSEIIEMAGELDRETDTLWMSDTASGQLLEFAHAGLSITIEVPVFRHGPRQFRFRAAPLRWPGK